MKYSMRRSLQLVVVLVFVLVASSSFVAGVLAQQLDTFDDSDIDGWVTGGAHPNPPIQVPDGGPTGAGDGFMQATTTGNAGGGGAALVVFNDLQWTGNYTAGGVTSISMDMTNLGPNDLFIRLVVESSNSPKFVSSDSVRVPVGSGWISGTFSLLEADLTKIPPTADYAATMADVTRLRIWHSDARLFPPPAVTGTIGIDNISSANTPLPIELVSFNAAASNGTVDIRWRTADEVNNVGFDVLERGNGKAGFDQVGFVAAKGSNSEYTFTLERGAGNYSYRLRQIDVDGTTTLLPIVEVTIAPDKFVLESPFPNPASDYATVDVLSPDLRRVRVSVVDLLGREVAVALDEVVDDARTSVRIDTKGYPSGVYILRAESNGHVISRALTVIH